MVEMLPKASAAAPADPEFAMDNALTSLADMFPDAARIRLS
jgi:hypothetical protein